MPRWKHYNKGDLRGLFQTRPGETRIGEIIQAGPVFADNTRIAILGIPEDIGIRANLGIGGAHTAWEAFLRAFLNIQSTTAFSGSHCCIWGHLDCSDIQVDPSATAEQLREAVSSIDRPVEAAIASLTARGILPIVVGGGHNNAYPIIKGAASGYQSSGRIREARINAINLDAHTDFRAMEGRHSGNGFRYAFHEGFLDHYAMIGLHRNYNAQNIIDEIAQEKRILYTFWEEIWLEKKLDFQQALQNAIDFTRRGLCGIELDLDSVEKVLSSAMTPSGIPLTLARQYLFRCAKDTDPAYLHICEGATRLENGHTDPTTGKSIAYLLSDFIRGLPAQHQ